MPNNKIIKYGLEIEDRVVGETSNDAVSFARKAMRKKEYAL